MSETVTSANNNISPMQFTYINLVSGNNIITVPALSPNGTATGVTIIKPTTNTVSPILKGNTSDIGVGLHPTDPDSMSIGAGMVNIILFCASPITGVKLVWT